jgi:hypothetical protein
MTLMFRELQARGLKEREDEPLYTRTFEMSIM